MHGAILHSPNMPSLCGAQLKIKHRENVTFYLIACSEYYFENSLEFFKGR
jgi:hypothetical protein